MSKPLTNLFFLSALTIATLAPSLSQAQASIRNLPQLSGLLIHHYACRLAIIGANGGVKEMNWDMLPNLSGHSAYEKKLALGSDQVVASVNAQMLQIEWARAGQPVAQAQAMIQNSPSSSFVLISVDPRNNGNQVHLNCDGVTYADLSKVGAQ